jgi:C-terminal processing protease CtpA/Prc
MKAGGRVLVAVLLLSVLACPLREVSGVQPTSGVPRLSVRLEAGDILDTTLSWIDEEYPGELDPLKVKREAAGAALKALEDVYSELLTERDLDPLLRATALTESPQTGVGMAVVKDSKFPSFLTVTSVFEGSPAQQAGLITAQILEIILYTAFIQ